MTLEENRIIRYENTTWNIEASLKGDNNKNKPLLSIKNDGKQIISIICEDDKIEAVVFFDAKEEPIKLTGFNADFNLDIVTVLIRNAGNKIELYLNGKLWDEDWPIGIVPLNGAVCDILAGDWSIYDTFSDVKSYTPYDKITNIKNWRPDGHNAGAGDCMPFSHGDTFHLFYLFDRRGHKSKWGLGAHQWAHISTKDLKNWIQHPMAISIDEQYEGSICTGSLIFYEGLYYAFYAVRMSDGSPARLTWATSSDCINFVKSHKYYELGEAYDSPSARDPKVIIDNDGVAHMFVTTSLKTDNDTKGCLAHLVSSNLQSWIPAKPLIVLDTEDQPECADYFSFNGWYYLIYSIRGVAKYFMAKEPLGPWEAPQNNIVIHSTCIVPKTAKFRNDRVIAAGFIITEPDRRYAGEIYINEMIQESDGTFRCIIPKELSIKQNEYTALPTS